MSSSELPVARRVSMILAKILASSARALQDEQASCCPVLMLYLQEKNKHYGLTGLKTAGSCRPSG